VRFCLVTWSLIDGYWDLITIGLSILGGGGWLTTVDEGIWDCLILKKVKNEEKKKLSYDDFWI
jgi:hypothetical protein